MDAARGTTNGQTDAAKLREEITRLAGVVKSLAGETAEEAKTMATDQVAEMERGIRRNPTQAMLIAAGVGFVVGLVLTRR